MTRLIVLDRDGVINRDSDDFVRSPQEWLPISGSLAAIRQLNDAGYTVAVATNQSGLGRGLFDQATLRRIHDKMCAEVAALGGRIDRIVYCPHRPDDGCDCRKPKPGLLHQLAQHYRIDLSGVRFVGDSVRDMDAAEAAGATPVLVLSGNGLAARDQLAAAGREVAMFADLQAVAAALGDSNV